MSNLNEIADHLSGLTVLEVVELVKMLESKWGVSAAAPAVAASTSEASGSAVAEKTSYNVVLVSAGANKVSVIKLIKEISGLGLKEAKDLADTAGSIIKKDVAKSEADDIKKKLEEAGSTIELK